MKTVLLTGGSGFIGQNVIEYFRESEKYKILAPSSKELNCIDEESVLAYLQDHEIDIVLNFAVYGDGIDRSKDGTKILEYNLKMFYNFANHSNLYEKMFYAGSGAEYDKRFPISMVGEDDIGHSLPVDQYGLMKYIVGRHIDKSDNIYSLRLFGIFGKYEYWPIKFISNICCKSLHDLPMSIYRNVKFDYLWIDDFLKVLEGVMGKERLKWHTYNVVSGKPVELFHLCELVRQHSGKSSRIIVCNDGYGNEYTASNGRLLDEFPDIEFTPIEESTKYLYQWYSEHFDDIDITRLIY